MLWKRGMDLNVCFRSVKTYFAGLKHSNLQVPLPTIQQKSWKHSSSLWWHSMKSVCVHVCIFPMQPLYLWSLILSELTGIMEAKESSKKKKPSSDFTDFMGLGSQPQMSSWNSTLWVIFSSCFADCSWLRYSSTLKLAVVNFSCNAFTSGLSAFEKKNGFGKNRICSEKLKLL